MSVQKRIEKTIQKPVDWLKEFKGAYLSKHQGEAIERVSTPNTHNESISLGKFQYQSAYGISGCDSYQELIFLLTGHKGTVLTNFTETIGRSSGSIGGFRAQITSDSVAQIGQFYPDGKRGRLPPEEVDLNR